MLDSMALASAAPKPVAVRLCFGRVKSGPTGPVKVEIGALVEGFRSRGARSVAVAAMLWFSRVIDQDVGDKGRKRADLLYRHMCSTHTVKEKC